MTDGDDMFYAFGNSEVLIRYLMDILSTIKSDCKLTVTYFQSIASVFFAIGLIVSIPQFAVVHGICLHLHTTPVFS